MAKKTAKKSRTSKSSSSAAGAPKKRKLTPAQLYSKLASLDKQLHQFMQQRADVARRIVTRDPQGQPPPDADAVVGNLPSGRGPLSTETVRAVFREIVSGCRALVAPERIAFLGPTYSYSHLAAIEHFGQSADLVPVSTIAAVFEEVHRKQANFGLVPVENSTDGRVADTLDMFTRMPLKICGEVQLRIHHHLMGKCRQADVIEVYSKPQALSQCRQWLARHLPSARVVEMTSTAAAARLACDKPGAAAIASRQAAVNYGLDIIAEDIEDNPHNITRFAVISHEMPKRTGKDKTAVMFQLEHAPGALADAMNIFKRAGLNLTWIESFPLSGSPSEYLFFAEFEGYPTEQRSTRAIEALGKKTVDCVVLGAYAKTEPV